jgi:GntR family transcriptional regulator, transcriptional repressor for pyruvate dehydrogenase complex
VRRGDKAGEGKMPEVPVMMASGRRSSQASRIARTLVQRITEGAYPIGSRMPSERQLALEFDVSRPVIREALSTVAALDVLDVQMGRGSFVVALPSDHSSSAPATLQDVVNIREVLETGALRLAALTPDEGRQTAVQTALQRLRTAVEEKSETVDADTALHGAIVAAAGSPLLLDLWRGIEQQITETIRISPHGRTMSEEILDLHTILADGCLGGDLNEAVDASRQLHEQNRQFLRSLLG